MADVAEKPTEVADKKEVEVITKDDVKEAGEKAEAAKEETEVKVISSVDNNESVSELERNIIRQIEYYFGDVNLNRDKFLQSKITEDEAGWVPISVLLTFKRLAALTTDSEAIVNAINKSEEGLVEISEDKQKLRRHPERPLPEQNEERRKEMMTRTAYAKGFELDADMSQIIDFFAPYEKVINIVMRKYLDKNTKEYKFKGSVFVTFEKKEQAQEFIEKEKVLFKERPLLRKWQEKYIEEKREEAKSKANKKAEKAKIIEKPKFELPKGAVVFFEDATENLTREIIREGIENLEAEWNVAYIDFSKGEKSGHIRFVEEGTAAKFIESLEDGKLKLKDDVILTVRALNADEEKIFLEKAVEQMANRRNPRSKHAKRKHGDGNNRRGNKRAKAGGGDDD